MGVLGKTATSSAQAIQGTMSKKISTTATALTKQGATTETVNSAVNSITTGMGTVGANTTRSMLKVETVTSVVTEVPEILVGRQFKQGMR